MNENNITTSEIKVKQWLLDNKPVYTRPVHPGIPDSEADLWEPAHSYEDGHEYILEENLYLIAKKVKPVLTAIEYESLVEIMAFFDWSTFKKIESMDWSDDHKDLDLGAVKEYVIDTFKQLVLDAKSENQEYRWTEGIYRLRFEYRKDIGLHLMYVPVQEGDD